MQGVLQSSQRQEKAQRGAQILLDLFCGCQGGISSRNTERNNLTVCWGEFSVVPKRDFTGKDHKILSQNIPATISPPVLEPAKFIILMSNVRHEQIHPENILTHSWREKSWTWRSSLELNALMDVSLNLIWAQRQSVLLLKGHSVIREASRF